MNKKPQASGLSSTSFVPILDDQEWQSYLKNALAKSTQRTYSSGQNNSSIFVKNIVFSTLIVPPYRQMS